MLRNYKRFFQDCISSVYIIFLCTKRTSYKAVNLSRSHCSRSTENRYIGWKQFKIEYILQLNIHGTMIGAMQCEIEQMPLLSVYCAKGGAAELCAFVKVAPIRHCIWQILEKTMETAKYYCC